MKTIVIISIVLGFLIIRYLGYYFLYRSTTPIPTTPIPTNPIPNTPIPTTIPIPTTPIPTTGITYSPPIKYKLLIVNNNLFK